MTTPVIKKVIIPRSSLSAVNDNNEYLVRFRVVSDDRNIFSQWSPIFVVPDLPLVPITSSVQILGTQVTLTWQDTTQRAAYDIFIKRDTGDYVFATTTTQRSYQFTNTATTSLRYIIQAEGLLQDDQGTKALNPTLKLFESQPISVV